MSTGGLGGLPWPRSCSSLSVDQRIHREKSVIRINRCGYLHLLRAPSIALPLGLGIVWGRRRRFDWPTPNDGLSPCTRRARLWGLGTLVRVGPSDNSYRNTVVRLPDLAVTESVLEDLTFENCRLVGPAVVLLLGGSMSRCSIEGDLDASIWAIPDDQERIIGAIGLRNCILVGCRISEIGFAVRESEIDAFRRGFGSTI